MQVILRFLLTIVITARVTLSIAQSSVVELSPEKSNYDIGTAISYYVDNTEKLTLTQILSAEIDQRFEPHHHDVIAAGITSAAFWVKIVTKNKKPEQISRWILTLDYPPLDSIILHQQDAEGNWYSQVSGDRILYYDRDIPHYKFAFALAMPDTVAHTYYLRVRTGGSILIGTHFESEQYFLADSLIGSIGYGFFIGAMIIMLFYNLFLYFSLKDISYLAYVLFILNNLVMQLCYSGHILQYVFPNDPDLANTLLPISVALTPLTAVFFTTTFLNTIKFTPVIHKILLGIAAFAVVNFFIAVFFSAHTAGFPNSLNISLLLVTVIVAGVMNLVKGNKSARFFLLAWSFLVIGGSIIWLKSFGFHLPNFIARNGSMISSLIEMVLLSIALADKYNLFKKEKDAAITEILNLKENANKVLEQRVTERTAELNESLINLKAAQQQLIQKEKLASLGEMTAGIAHEIQNPLNFTNNFSEVSAELAMELKEELEKGGITEAKAISEDLIQNLQKINHHGKRASSIVRNMLEHSRASSGVMELTDLNTLAEEYIQLSYHGMRSKHKDFNVEIVKDLAKDLPQVKIIRQDIGRVLLNLLNNAFYVVNAVARSETGKEYQPRVIVRTKLSGNKVMVSVEDNGSGMPESVMRKVFEPFFTTKPTGEGTGLGLSLSYDIITKGHNGTFEVNSTEGKGSTFEIKLPAV